MHIDFKLFRVKYVFILQLSVKIRISSFSKFWPNLFPNFKIV